MSYVTYMNEACHTGARGDGALGRADVGNCAQKNIFFFDKTNFFSCVHSLSQISHNIRFCHIPDCRDWSVRTASTALRAVGTGESGKFGRGLKIAKNPPKTFRMACCEWRTAGAGLKPFRLPRAQALRRRAPQQNYEHRAIRCTFTPAPASFHWTTSLGLIFRRRGAWRH